MFSPRRFVNLFNTDFISRNDFRILRNHRSCKVQSVNIAIALQFEHPNLTSHLRCSARTYRCVCTSRCITAKLHCSICRTIFSRNAHPRIYQLHFLSRLIVFSETLYNYKSIMSTHPNIVGITFFTISSIINYTL